MSAADVAIERAFHNVSTRRSPRSAASAGSVDKVVGNPLATDDDAPDDEVAESNTIGGAAVTLRPVRDRALPASPRTSEERRALDHSLSTLYDRLHAAQHAAELAGEDDVAELLRALRTVVHTRLVHLAWGVPR